MVPFISADKESAGRPKRKYYRYALQVLKAWMTYGTRHQICPNRLNVCLGHNIWIKNQWECKECQSVFPELPHNQDLLGPCPCRFFDNRDWIDARVQLALDGELEGLFE